MPERRGLAGRNAVAALRWCLCVGVLCCGCDGLLGREEPARAPTELERIVEKLNVVESPASGPFVYLTWQRDPSTTMTVNYHSAEGDVPSVVYYDTVSHAGKAPAAYAHQAVGRAHRIAKLAASPVIHWVELTGLTPGAAYYFVTGHPEATEYRFRTIPDDGRALRFVVGGDMGISPATVPPLLIQAARQDPHFAVIGGDVAYANGRLSAPAVRRWNAWLANWQVHMVTPDGYLIPMVIAIGNHEVRGMFDGAPYQAPFYFCYFAQQPGPCAGRDGLCAQGGDDCATAAGDSVFVRRFGRDVVLLLLDTSHVRHHEAQVAWLEATLQAHAETPFKFAAYHVPLFPSYRAMAGKYEVRGRTHWLAPFETGCLTAAFEHHDHRLKRAQSRRLGAGCAEPVLFVGDGCWGLSPRQAETPDNPYGDLAELATSAAAAHFWRVDVSGGVARFRAMDADGAVLDEVVRHAPDAGRASAGTGARAGGTVE